MTMSDFTLLTPRETEVAKLLALGLSCREIADRFGRDVKTIDTHRLFVLRKLGLANTAQLARVAIREGFVSMHDEVDDG